MEKQPIEAIDQTQKGSLGQVGGELVVDPSGCS